MNKIVILLFKLSNHLFDFANLCKIESNIKKFISSISVFYLLTYLILNLTYANDISAFKKGYLYSSEGRWLEKEKINIFLINERTTNYFYLESKDNPFNLKHNIKYKLCFRVQEDCFANCVIDILFVNKILRPWENTKDLKMNSSGEHEKTNEVSCKRKEE